jgi:hypothetical protein
MWPGNQLKRRGRAAAAAAAAAPAAPPPGGIGRPTRARKRAGCRRRGVREMCELGCGRCCGARRPASAGMCFPFCERVLAVPLLSSTLRAPPPPPAFLPHCVSSSAGLQPNHVHLPLQIPTSCGGAARGERKQLPLRSRSRAPAAPPGPRGEPGVNRRRQEKLLLESICDPPGSGELAF